jgi:transcriptional regulator with XRE-family HTH domain
MANRVTSKKEVGQRLYFLRHMKRWSLDAVEKETGLPSSTLSRWERGIAAGYPPIERLDQLAQLYGVTVPYLLDPEASPPSGWS